jgi:predicted permease
MHLLHTLQFKLKCLFSRQRKEAELAEEMHAHLEMQIEANRAAGLAPEEARMAALRKLGGMEQAKELYRDEWSIRWLEALARDVRHGTRVLLSSPGFTLVAVATFALGIGASSAVFSVVETVLLRPLPFPQPERLVDVAFTLTPNAPTNVPCSVSELEDLRELSDVFAEVSMVFPMDGNLTGVAEPQRVEALAVSANYFRLLGVAPALGRTFGTEEASVPGWAQGCVLSHDAWKNYFGGDPAVVGKKFSMDYDTFRVVGVMPPGFRHPGRTLVAEVDVWFTGGLRTAPFSATPQRNYRLIPGAIGRLAPGVSPAAAQARLDNFAARVRNDFPQDYRSTERWTPHARGLQEMLVGEVRSTIWLLFGAVVLVLLICCATVANLMLVRSIARRQEMAVRCALGASRSAIVRQLVVESGLIAAAGGIGGLLLAYNMPPLLLALAPQSVPHLNELAVNGPVLAFALGMSGVTGLLFGLLPALRASKFELVPDLKVGGRSGAAPTAQRRRIALVAAQVALSMMLLAGAGLLLRSFLNAWQTAPGFEPRHVVTGRMWLPPPTDPQARQSYQSHENRVRLVRELERRLRALPGVEAAAIGTEVPLAGTRRANEIVADNGRDEAGTNGDALMTAVTTDYFRTLGVRLLHGRAFTDADDGRNGVALINAAAAERYWAGMDPIGRRVGRRHGDTVNWCTIVGVVDNVKAESLDRPDQPQVYVPLYQESALGLAFLVRAKGGASTMVSAVRGEIHAADADLPIYSVFTMDELLSRSLTQRKFIAVIIGSFAGVSLLLAGLGIYGVIALTVTQRGREIGLRLALGASHRQITTMVLRNGLLIACAGIGIGVLGGALATLALRGLLFKTHPLDPLTWSAIAALLLAVAALACWLPARRATKVDPMVALRCD